MTPETIAIIAVGIGMAGLILNSQRTIGERLNEVVARLEKVESGQIEQRERMAHLEGLLEGLREAIAHRAAA